MGGVGGGGGGGCFCVFLYLTSGGPPFPLGWGGPTLSQSAAMVFGQETFA